MRASFSVTLFLSFLQPLTFAFTHPGLLHTSSDFDRIQSKVNAKAEPWITGWTKLTSNDHAASTYVPSAQATVYRGTPVNNEYVENYATLFNDAAAAYALAIRWKVSGETAYADAAAGVLDAWTSTLKNLTGTADKYIASGVYGYQLANAAEILRSYSGWPAGSFYNLVTMLEDIFYPMNNIFLLEHNDKAIDHYWASWDLANIATMQAIGILSDNTTMYNQAVDYFKNGAGNGAIEKAIWKIHTEEGTGKSLGQGQEAGRDQAHAMLDFALLGVIAQQSYNQGDDLFAYLDNRILAGAEYIAKYNLNETVPYSTYTNSDVTQTVVSEVYRGDIRPLWELLYAHYGVIKGLDASWTEKFMEWSLESSDGAEGGGGNYGPNSGGFDQLGYGTLLYRLDSD